MLAEVDAKTKALQAELEKPTLEPEKIFALSDDLGDARKKLLRSRCHSIIKVHETLTPEQLKTLTSMVNN